MKKKEGIFFEINLSVFPLPVYVSLGQSPEDLIASINLGTEVDYTELIETLIDKECSLAQTTHLSNGITIIYIYDIPRSLAELCTAVHESIHASHFVLERVGIPINMEGTETQAYVVTYIVEQIFKQFHSSKLVLQTEMKKPKPKQLDKVVKKVVKKGRKNKTH